MAQRKPVSTQLGLGLEPSCAPFLKWVGGKRQLVPQIRALMPRTYERYLEPFVGGGALFFDVAPDARRHGPAYLGDVNQELLTAYYGVQQTVEDVIKILGEHKAAHGKEYYYQTRAADWSVCGWDTTAARMIYLNKTCFNGLYRVNKKGKFNVTMGRYDDPAILDADGLRACAHVLERAQAEFHYGDFKSIYRVAEKGDFVYFDPPYVEVSGTANFKGYAPGGFDEEQQRKLAALFTELTDDGVYCMASNSDTPLVRELYADHPIREVSRAGSVSSKPGKRQRVGELLIRGWAW